jgi:hypothetical protein
LGTRLSVKAKEKYEFNPLQFIRRFSLHILPKRFVKIRHYGFFGSGNVKAKAFATKNKVQPVVKVAAGSKIRKCQCCKTGFTLFWCLISEDRLSFLGNSQK